MVFSQNFRLFRALCVKILEILCDNMILILIASTHDQEVFSFYPDERFCEGFEEVLRRYRELVPQLRLAGSPFELCIFQFSHWSLLPAIILHPLMSVSTGPTSFAPVIEMAITIVEQSRGQYHVLLIIADGQVLISSVFIAI